MKQPDSDTSQDFSEVENKDQLKFRGKQDKSPKKDPSKTAKPEVPKIERSMPIAVKGSNLFVRTIWTLVMLFGFIVIIAAGHFYCSMIVLVVATGAFKEILDLKRNREKETQIPVSSFLNWYFFAVAIFYFYIPQITNKVPSFTLKNNFLALILRYHNFISFSLWTLGFLIFVLSLKKGFYRYQFRRFGWTHMTCFFIIAPTSGVISNIYSGLIWFVFPALLVIANDIFAYLFGITFGKTPLIELSPKKTWEGFIGGMVTCLVFAFIFSIIFSKFEYIVCPQETLTIIPFQKVTCEIPSVFLPNPQNIGGVSDFQIHSLVFSLFASFVAPFGGFFASGFKRAIKVKDFADIIPGHGGITDRMDCQFLMGLFVFLYYSQFVHNLKALTSFILNELTPEQQLEIYNELKNKLSGINMTNL